MSSFPSPWDKPPPPQQSSLQMTRKFHHSSRDLSLQTFASITQHTSTSSQIVRHEVELKTAVPVYQSSVKMTLSSWILLRTPTVAPFRQRRPRSKNPPNGHPPFHHGHQLSTSTTANYRFRPSATLTRLTHPSSSCRLQRQFYPDCVGSRSMWPDRQ